MASERWQCLTVSCDEDGVASLALNRPAKRNAFDPQMASELEDAVGELEREARVIVLSGSGGTFSAGADLAHVRNASTDPAAVRAFLTRLNAAFDAVERATVPVVAAVEGHALAGGFELLQCCDVVVVATEAVLGDQHANFGLLPGAGGSQRLPRLIGKQRAMALLLTGDWVGGQEAVALGLAYRAVPASELAETARDIARRIASHSRPGLAHMKDLVLRGADLPVDQGVALEIDTFLGYVPTPDPQEGLAAFAERRAPRFG